MAVNPYSGLSKALMQGVKDSPLALPYGVENAPFEKPADQSPWAKTFVLMNQPSVATLGSEGQDAHDGILQIDLNYPLNTGEAAVTAKADELTDFFKAGKRLAHSGVELTVTSCGRSRGREVEGWYRVSMTVAWFARVSRN
ncbi:tail terminator protein [Xanthomonas phage Elanor]|uniref:Tail terminator protein n=1 Tax=Xanthomonas phage Elanor TaxID=2939127 RepID=A0A9E7J5P4_9CAUD|nr:tail terminator protein [Xanthomonas phage Elanor]URA07003.1 tail terminator protein [Xanthomonas phage Elanor]